MIEQQFLDAVAVAMITPGPVVITVGFIGYLVAGPVGSVVAALATFVPCYLFTVIPAPHFEKWSKNVRMKSFVDGVSAAATGALGGAVLVLGQRSIHDVPTAIIAAASLVALVYVKKLNEPILIGITGVIGVVLSKLVG